jgi:hypothetical protein
LRPTSWIYATSWLTSDSSTFAELGDKVGVVNGEITLDLGVIEIEATGEVILGEADHIRAGVSTKLGRVLAASRSIDKPLVHNLPAATAAAALPAKARGLRSVAVGFGWCLRGGIGTEQQGIELEFERGETLVLGL